MTTWGQLWLRTRPAHIPSFSFFFSPKFHGSSFVFFFSPHFEWLFFHFWCYFYLQCLVTKFPNVERPSALRALPGALGEPWCIGGFYWYGRFMLVLNYKRFLLILKYIYILMPKITLFLQWLRWLRPFGKAWQLWSHCSEWRGWMLTYNMQNPAIMKKSVWIPQIDVTN